jgi:DNA-binding MarR family transcriptional regulator
MQTTATSPTDPSACHCLALRQAARALTAAYDQALSGSGLRVTQFSILAALAPGAPLTVNEIARLLVMDRTTLSRNLKPLERDALVRIAASAHDRRERVIVLTEQGRTAVAAALPAWHAAQRAFEDRFGAARARALHGTLGHVVDTGLALTLPAD